jgi:hypothetical protein
MSGLMMRLDLFDRALLRSELNGRRTSWVLVNHEGGEQHN